MIYYSTLVFTRITVYTEYEAQILYGMTLYRLQQLDYRLQPCTGTRALYYMRGLADLDTYSTLQSLWRRCAARAPAWLAGAATRSGNPWTDRADGSAFYSYSGRYCNRGQPL